MDSVGAAESKSLTCPSTPPTWSLSKGTPRAHPRSSRGTRLSPSASRRCSDGGRGDVSLCVRLKPGYEEETAFVDGETVRLKPLVDKGLLSFLGDTPNKRSDGDGEWSVCCDHAFGTQATQEELYDTAVAPIVDAVSKGYNGAVIAYGQTGSGKTYSMIGSKTGPARGVAPRAIAGVFAGLRKAAWRIEVSVLEVYNEKVRDLLAPGSTVTTVDVHEVRENGGGLLSFRCPEAITWIARSPEEAMAALMEGCRRRETARTDMNHHSSRSHLVFTLNVAQSDREAGATLRSRLHLVDLAGSERLKRSLLDSPRSRTSAQTARVAGARSPRCQRREAGEINKSLSQLALVIQRLTSPGSQYVPYRDSMLTRLLAESFGGSSKTCLLVCCSPGIEDREETKSSLEFGRRAKMVRNKATINLEVDSEPSAVMKALMAKELHEMQLDRDALIAARETSMMELKSMKEAAFTSARQQEVTQIQCSQLEEQLREAQRIAADATDAFSEMQEARDELEGRYCREVAEQRALLQASTERVASFLEQAQSDRPQMELASEAVKWQEAHAKAAAKLEEQMLDSRAQLQKQMASLEDAKASMQQQHAKETVELRRQLADVRSELTKTQEEKALIMKRAQEDRSALLRHWHEEVMCLREDKAAVFNTLENEKLSLRRRLQLEVTELQQSKDETVAELEREKAVLRDKWQTAMEETGVLQARVMALEESFEDRLRSRTVTLEEEKMQIQRQCHDEIGRLLEEKATEVARLTSERVQLQRRLDETAASMDEEKGAILVQMEAEKGHLQCQLQQVSQEQLRMSEEKVILAEGQASEMAKAHETWGAAFSRELHASRELQKTEASRLRNLVQTMSERTQASEWQTSLLQAELAILQEHLDPQPTRGVQTPSAVQGSVSCVASVSGSDPSSPNRKASSTEEMNRNGCPEGKRLDGDAQTETEPEGETTLPEAGQRAAYEPPNPTLLRSLPGMWSSPSFKDIKTTERCQETSAEHFQEAVLKTT